MVPVSFNYASFPSTTLCGLPLSKMDFIKGTYAAYAPVLFCATCMRLR